MKLLVMRSRSAMELLCRFNGRVFLLSSSELELSITSDGGRAVDDARVGQYNGRVGQSSKDMTLASTSSSSSSS